LWWENPFLTTASQFGRGKPAGGVQRYRYNGDGLSDEGGIRRYRENGDGLSDGEYIFERLQGK